VLITALVGACSDGSTRSAGSTSHAGGGATSLPPAAPYIALCTESSIVYVNPRTAAVEATVPFEIPVAAIWQPALRDDSRQYEDVNDGPTAYDCGSWSFDASLDHIAGSSEGRLATLELRHGVIDYRSPAPMGGVDLLCCGVYDPMSEAFWSLRASAGPGKPLAYRLVGPSGPTAATYYGQQAAIAFAIGRGAVPGELIAAEPKDPVGRVNWLPLTTSLSAAAPPFLPEAVMQYGAQETVDLPDRTLGVLRHSDDGSQIAFVASSGRDCELWTVPTAGGSPHEVGTLPYTPPAGGGEGCGAEVIRDVLSP
jgi:hypothetical protein